MRIAFAIEHFSPVQGGAEQYAWGLSRWLTGRGHELDVYTCHAAERQTAGLGVHVLDAEAALGRTRQARFAAALGRELDRARHDVVHGFNHVRPCDVLRLGGGVHLAFEEYNLLSVRHPFGRRLKQWVDELTPKYRALRENEHCQFDDPHRRFIAISQRVADDMLRFHPHVRGRVHVIRNAVDLDVFNPEEADKRRADTRRQLGLSDTDTALLFVSNNYRLKGLPDLIRALPRVRAALGPGLRLLVAGRGDQAAYQRMARRAGVGDSVIMYGPTTDLIGCYGAADLLVHPSYYDAFGFVALEAAACGLPVVVSRNCGVSEIMADSAGCVLVEMPCAPDALADAIVRAANPAFRDRARDAQWTLAQNHPIERNYEAVEALYRQVVREKAGRAV
ncbi:MAG: glycosyltransferase family 4 protein [Kiritimatiellae bacterium]|nr:glycosyltransferase family 4 protein [Kiritimatiellia bacterium]